MGTIAMGKIEQGKAQPGRRKVANGVGNKEMHIRSAVHVAA